MTEPLKLITGAELLELTEPKRRPRRRKPTRRQCSAMQSKRSAAQPAHRRHADACQDFGSAIGTVLGTAAVAMVATEEKLICYFLVIKRRAPQRRAWLDHYWQSGQHRRARFMEWHADNTHWGPEDAGWTELTEWLPGVGGNGKTGE